MMKRMTPLVARELYHAGTRPDEIVDYNPLEHQDEMEAVMTGVAGLIFTSDIKAVAAQELGSRIPCFAIDVDVIRLFVAPEWKEVTPRRIVFEAFTYNGNWETFDTDRMLLLDREAFIEQVTILKDKVPWS